MDAAGEGLAVLAFAALWLVVAEYGYVAAAELYGWRTRSLLMPLLTRAGRPASDVPAATRASTVAAAVTSYLLSVYGFSVAFFFVSLGTPAAFTQRLGLSDALYFSVVTAATVGYGDIAPVAGIARVLVIVEILMSFGYAVFIFSALATGGRSQQGG